MNNFIKSLAESQFVKKKKWLFIKNDFYEISRKSISRKTIQLE